MADIWPNRISGSFLYGRCKGYPVHPWLIRKYRHILELRYSFKVKMADNWSNRISSSLPYGGYNEYLVPPWSDIAKMVKRKILGSNKDPIISWSSNGRYLAKSDIQQLLWPIRWISGLSLIFMGLLAKRKILGSN